jgi:hypothetical protein
LNSRILSSWEKPKQTIKFVLSDFEKHHHVIPTSLNNEVPDMCEKPKPTQEIVMSDTWEDIKQHLIIPYLSDDCFKDDEGIATFTNTVPDSCSTVSGKKLHL